MLFSVMTSLGLSPNPEKERKEGITEGRKGGRGKGRKDGKWKKKRRNKKEKTSSVLFPKFHDKMPLKFKLSP